MKAKEVIRILQRTGFYIHHQSGSHVQLKHQVKKELRVTVPFHNRDLPKPIIRSILRQAQLTIEEFNSLR
ncbi:MAG: type II toxin-antitoxin system HicA family toxin [Ignavibacteriae bacterium]|nr:type II toxin-antitoxin system HicA family toxin [Ignavibacteriota bacterium]